MLKRTLFSVLAITGLMVSSSQAAQSKQEMTLVGPKINVLLAHDESSALVEVRGPYRVLSQESGAQLSVGKTGKRFSVHAIQNGLRWAEEYPGVHQVVIEGTAPTTKILIDGMEYKGSVTIYQTQSNRISVVNEVSIEDYLRSTLAMRFERTISSEAMAAIVIATRTEVYARCQSLSGNHSPWHITRKEANYHGHGVTRQANGVDSAVERTRFMVLKSTKSHLPLKNFVLHSTKAQELAQSGYDAKRILEIACPQGKIGVTVDLDKLVSNKLALR